MKTAHRFNLRTGGEALSFYLANRLVFESSSRTLWSKVKPAHIHLDSYGELPDKYHASVDEAWYIVYSYHTPIAWASGNTWHIPEVNYSASSTKHRNVLVNVLQAIAEENNLTLIME